MARNGDYRRPDHFGIHYYRTWMGTLGVQLFFMLSGYLMANLLFMKAVPLPSFFMRRFSRIVPTVFVFVPTMAKYAYFRTESFPRLDEFIASSAGPAISIAVMSSDIGRTARIAWCVK